MTKLKAYVDGSYYPEAHKGVSCFIIDGQKPVVLIESNPFGSCNQFEYLAVLNLLKNLPIGSNVKIYSDSALLVHQLRLEWQIRNARLFKLFGEIKDVADQKGIEYDIGWVSRNDNPAGHHLERMRKRKEIYGHSLFSANHQNQLAEQKTLARK